MPSKELLRRLSEELKTLDAIDENDSPAEVVAQVDAVSEAIQQVLDEEGVSRPPPTPTPTPSLSETPSPTPEPTATP